MKQITHLLNLRSGFGNLRSGFDNLRSGFDNLRFATTAPHRTAERERDDQVFSTRQGKGDGDIRICLGLLFTHMTMGCILFSFGLTFHTPFHLILFKIPISIPKISFVPKIKFQKYPLISSSILSLTATTTLSH